MKSFYTTLVTVLIFYLSASSQNVGAVWSVIPYSAAPQTTTGTLDGVTFTMSNVLVSPWGANKTADLSTSNYFSAPLSSNQAVLDLYQNSLLHIVFNRSISNLRLYIKFGRPGYYVFSKTPRVLTGAAAMTTSADTLFINGPTPGGVYGYGIVEFAGSTDSLSIINVNNPFYQTHFLTFGVSTCPPDSSSINPAACRYYISPSGKVYFNSGLYRDTLSSSRGCDSIINIDLTIVNIDVSTTINGSLIEAISNAGAYQWLDCDSNYSIIAGETGKSFAPKASGNYAVEIVKNDCADTSECVRYVHTHTGISSSKNEHIEIYPNPTSGSVNLSLGSVYSFGQIYLMNLQGQKVYEASFKDQKHYAMDLDLRKGIYLLQIQNAEGNSYTKMILIK